MSKHILIADDDVAIVAALHVLLNEAGYTTSTAQSIEEIKFLVAKNTVDLALLDMNYHLDTTSGQEGLEVLAFLTKAHPNLTIVAMTGWSSVELSVKAMQAGAGDFIEKPWDNDRLLSVIRNQIRLAEGREREEKLASENTLLKESLGKDTGGYIAEDTSSRALLSTAEQVAGSDISILLLGENGTGKSHLAHEIHMRSHRKDKPFVSVNMGAIPESLFESELFGHVKGAFTDAKSDRAGRFEVADGGTLFLDEVANIPLSQQAKLLRVLESQEYERVGSSKTFRADVRIISATNADLVAMCDAGEFRRDLLYRLSGIELTVPALRHRQEDIALLAKSALETYAKKYHKVVDGFDSHAKAALKHYDWPGNVRELNHCIERAVVLAKASMITPQDLRLSSQISNEANSAEVPDGIDTQELSMEEIEKHIIESRLRKYNGLAQVAAKSLKMSRSAFYRRLEKYAIDSSM